MVQVWFSVGSAGSVLVQLQAEPKLNQLNQNWTQTKPQLNQTEPNWTTTEPKVIHICWFSFGSGLVQFGSVLVQLVHFWFSLKMNQNLTNWTQTEPKLNHNLTKLNQNWTKLNQNWTKPEPTLSQNWTTSYGSVLVQCWFRFGSVIGSGLVQLVQLRFSFKLNCNKTDTEPIWTKTDLKLNQHWTTTKPTIEVQCWFSFGSGWFSLGSIGYVLVQLKAKPKPN